MQGKILIIIYHKRKSLYHLKPFPHVDRNLGIVWVWGRAVLHWADCRSTAGSGPAGQREVGRSIDSERRSGWHYHIVVSCRTTNPCFCRWPNSAPWRCRYHRPRKWVQLQRGPIEPTRRNRYSLCRSIRLESPPHTHFWHLIPWSTDTYSWCLSQVCCCTCNDANRPEG